MELLVVTFGAALASSWGLTHLASSVGRRFGILDYPDKERKWHARATPRTGGLAVCATLLAGAVLLIAFGSRLSTFVPPPSQLTTWLSVSTALLCGLGLWDDKWGMQARTKLLWQIIAILPFVCWGRSSSAVSLFGWPLDSAVVTVPLILFWLVSCTNFVNLMDGLDGLAGSVGAIIALAVAALAGWNQQAEVALLASLLGGSLLGFLLHNWPPARVFLGDCGSLPLGFLVGALSLESAAKKAAGMTLAVPIVLLCIPMFDTSMAILRRKLNGRQIGQGDRAHIHHCLRDRGLSPTQTLLALGGLCAVTAAAAIASTMLNNDWIAVGTGGVLLAFLIAGRVFGFDETMLLVRHVQAVGSMLRAAPRALRARLFVVRLEASVASDQSELWQKIVARAKQLSRVEIEFVCEDTTSGRKLALLNWNSTPRPTDDVDSCWQVSYAIPRGEGIRARAEARGALPGAGNAHPDHELSELLAALCRHWPLGEASNTQPSDRLPIQPKLLAPNRPAIRDAA
ncbi:MAG: undecaprenyl/decaprenyl-phosphate alpha-N-acetylglucosaminyl 1-phosphate transferase [Planctomycetaceae bacterium]|nr:undecaprenyl/decaprenyl-phosphate alpha-N-acetylglucosaminyl 1-phosphate transferase [Planctomycetaceae bacterium]